MQLLWNGEKSASPYMIGFGKKYNCKGCVKLELKGLILLLLHLMPTFIYIDFTYSEPAHKMEKKKKSRVKS